MPKQLSEGDHPVQPAPVGSPDRPMLPRRNRPPTWQRTWTDTVVVINETGFLKQSFQMAGVTRQYSSTLVRLANWAFLACTGPQEHILLDRKFHLPKVWIDNGTRLQKEGMVSEPPLDRAGINLMPFPISVLRLHCVSASAANAGHSVLWQFTDLRLGPYSQTVSRRPTGSCSGSGEGTLERESRLDAATAHRGSGRKLTKSRQGGSATFAAVA